MAATPDDVADQHLARWERLWLDADGRDRLTEGALFRMVRLAGHSREALRELLRTDDLSYDEFMTLHALVGGQVDDGVATSTPARLAEHAGVSRAAMTGRLDKLERAGLIVRSPDPADGRGVVVRITPDGRSAWDRIIGRWSAAEQDLLGGLSVAELTRLNALLRKACAHIEGQGDRQHHSRR
ncbi:MarR family winged helix-turn-helix transcriptional regulator [Flexivirga sp. B27]